MESVYLETTFISYLVARSSRDLLVAAHQQTTQDWWTSRRNKFECFISQVVLDEASVGDSTEVEKRQAVMNALPVLEISEDAETLTQAILSSGLIPPRAVGDAAHIAVATVHQMDFLLTWNCKHLANAQIARRISLVCEGLSWQMPVICTPEALMGE
jgi:hypothetical protein